VLKSRNSRLREPELPIFARRLIARRHLQRASLHTESFCH
jgi:hypothetical protein